jgi:putative SOS response-associated peptidase YedK
VGDLALAGGREDPQLYDRDHDTERALRRASQPHAVVLKPAPWPAWLGEETADLPHLKALLAPYPSDDMISWPVSARVGNVRNNDPGLIKPITLH